MISFKAGVRCLLIRKETWWAIGVAEPIWVRLGAEDGELVVTSLRDGAHRPGSLHYRGLAADLRTRNLPNPQVVPARNELARVLGPDYDVILEDHDGPNEHIHVEYDPKKGGVR